ncbi:MAG: hypothetical protein ACFE9I_17350 [Candidatus Hermodarchaeota archaeon]
MLNQIIVLKFGLSLTWAPNKHTGRGNNGKFHPVLTFFIISHLH